MPDANGLLAHWRERSESTIESALAGATASPRLQAARRHAVLAGGKRMRPLLVHAAVHALDAHSGREIWKTKVSDHPLAQVRGSPKLYKGTLYVPVSSGEEAAAEDPAYPCCTFRGTLVAMDALTGRIIWKTYSIPEAPKPANKNPADTQTYAPSNATI